MLLQLHVSRVEPHNVLRVGFKFEGEYSASVDLPEETWRFRQVRLQAAVDAPMLQERKAQVERYGANLFSALTQAEPVRNLWAAVERQIPGLRIEIEDSTGVVPWELLRTVQSGHPLSCRVQSFVRRVPGAAAEVTVAEEPRQKLRILFVVPRIRGKEGYVLRSTALRMVNGLCATCRDYFQLDWLDTPTFERLEKKLRLARESGQPYHVVHYDGHGVYGLNPADSAGPGLLVLEGENKAQPVRGQALARLLADNQVVILALNAAYTGDDATQEVDRAFRAIAAQALESGIPGVLVIPEVMDAGTAAKIVGDIYATLAQGESLGAAVSSERRYLYGAKPGLEWGVPLVYESQAVRVSPRIELENAPIFRITIMPKGRERFPAEMDAALRAMVMPGEAAGGDEWLFLLDQAFEANQVVMLSGPDETVNSATAAEYARWQGNLEALSGQPVLYTSLRECFNFTELLENFGQVYERALLDRGISWQSLDDRERVKLIQDLAKKAAVFWIWDHCESIQAASVWGWDEEERGKAADFLKSFPAGMGRILLLTKESLPALEDIALMIAGPGKPSGYTPAEKQFVETDQPDFRRLLSGLQGSKSSDKQDARSFVQAAAAYAREFAGQPGDLLVVETSLRAAVEFALQSSWRGPVGEIMPILRLALLSQRKYAVLARLLERSTVLFTTLRAGRIRIRKGWEEVGMKLVAACVEVSRLRGRLSEARGWQSMRVDFLRRKRASGLMRELSLLAELHLAAGSPAAIDVLLKGYRLSQRAGDRVGAVDCAYRIAGALAQLPAGQDLRRAQRWITISRRLLDPGDATGQGRCSLLEGKIAYEHFVQAQINQPERLVEWLNEALGCTFEGLEMIPPHEPLEAARAHEMLGFLYLQANQMKEEAVRHYDQAITLFEAAKDPGASSRARFNLAVALFLLGDMERARGYTHAALRGFEALGPEFLVDAQKARRLLQRYG